MTDQQPSLAEYLYTMMDEYIRQHGRITQHTIWAMGREIYRKVILAKDPLGSYIIPADSHISHPKLFGVPLFLDHQAEPHSVRMGELVPCAICDYPVMLSDMVYSFCK